MRRFLIVGHTQRADAPIPLHDAAGAGRWDVLARSVTSALLVSNGIRRDTEIHLVLTGAQPPRTLRVRGADVRNLNVDERAVLGLLSKAATTPSVGRHWAESGPGVAVANRGLQEALAEADAPIVLLREDGEPLTDATARTLHDAWFVLSDHQEFTPADVAILEARAPRRCGLGPVSLHTSSCIAILHNWLDRTR